MADEISAGLVLYTGRAKEPAGAEILLLRHPRGHWDFPKGHGEAGETNRQTALRELAEETGFAVPNVNWVEGFDQRVEYSYRDSSGRLRQKEVHYLAAGVDEKPGEPRLSHEHTDGGWFDFEQALDRLTYESSKQVLEALVEHVRLERW